MIPIPLSLLVVNRVTGVSGRPYGGSIISTLLILLPLNFASNIPLSIVSRVVVLTTLITGALVYPEPPSTTVTTPTVLDSLIVMIGDIKASGLNVGSDEYSNPSLITLV